MSEKANALRYEQLANDMRTIVHEVYVHFGLPTSLNMLEAHLLEMEPADSETNPADIREVIWDLLGNTRESPDFELSTSRGLLPNWQHIEVPVELR